MSMESNRPFCPEEELEMCRQEDIIAMVRRELQRQRDKWGIERNHSEGHWCLILSEEVGEVANAILEDGGGIGPTTISRAVVNELVQVAAVAVAWAENIERRRTDRGEDPLAVRLKCGWMTTAKDEAHITALEKLTFREAEELGYFDKPSVKGDE